MARLRSISAMVAVVIGVMLTVTISGAAGAETRAGGETTTTIPLSEQPLEIPSMLPRPNTGVPPQSAYDRGGLAQILVFFGLVSALTIIYLLYRRDKRRSARRIDARAASTGGGQHP